MATNTTITTQMVVQLDDQFTVPLKQAMDSYKNFLAEAQSGNSFTASSLRDIEKLKKAYKEVKQVQIESRVDQKEIIDGYFNGIEEEVLDLGFIEGALGAATLATTFTIFPQTVGAATVALGAFYIAWKEQQLLEEWRVGEQPVEEYAEGVKESLDQLSNSQPLALPPISEDVVRSLETTKSCLEQIQQMQDIFITVNLLDSATEEAKRIRGEIEKTFSQDITQRVTIAEQTVRTISGPGPGPRAPDPFFDGGPEFLTSSKNLTGFGDKVGTSPKIKVPGFSSGIDRVPRDMLAMIHKDEAVLPKIQADDFRQGNSNGMIIQNLNFSFNVPNGLKLDREEFRNLAFQMRDELKRLDRRMN